MLPRVHHPSCRSTTCGCPSIPHPAASRASSYSLRAFASPFLLQPPSKKTKQGVSVSSSPRSPCAARLPYFRGAGGKARAARGRGIKADKERRRAAWLPGIYIPGPNRAGCSDSSAAGGEMLHLQQTSIRTRPHAGRGGDGCSPSPNPRSAGATWLFKVQRLLRIDKGGEKRSYHLPGGSKL